MFNPGSTEKWWVSMKNEAELGESWKKLIRLPRLQFVNADQKLQEWIAPDPRSPNFRALTPQKKSYNNFVLLKG